MRDVVEETFLTYCNSRIRRIKYVRHITCINRLKQRLISKKHVLLRAPYIICAARRCVKRKGRKTESITVKIYLAIDRNACIATQLAERELAYTPLLSYMRLYQLVRNSHTELEPCSNDSTSTEWC